MHKTSSLLAAIMLWAVSCSSGNITTGADPGFSANETFSANAIISLICGHHTNCLSKVCANAEKCPLMIALSNEVIFDFVKTYSECEGCNTPVFSPETGIGKCIEYKILDELQVWTVSFWVSDNCKFRYADPTHARISVKVDKKAFTIVRVIPNIAYIEDPSYCTVHSDCNGLSGSGIPLTGCKNLLYAPLNRSGYYEHSRNICECVANQCKQK